VFGRPRGRCRWWGGQQSLPLLVLRARSKAIRVSGEAGRELLKRPGCDRSVMRGGLHGDQGASRWVAGDLADIDSQRCTTDQARPGAVNTAAALFNNNYRGVAHSAARSLARTRRPRVESRSRRVPRGASRGRLSRSVMGKRRCGPLLLASTGRLCGGAPLEHWSVLHRSHDATADSVSANSTASLSSFVCTSVPCITSARHAGHGIVTVLVTC
jgi:hypothetical protein